MPGAAGNIHAEFSEGRAEGTTPMPFRGRLVAPQALLGIWVRAALTLRLRATRPRLIGLMRTAIACK